MGTVSIDLAALDVLCAAADYAVDNRLMDARSLHKDGDTDAALEAADDASKWSEALNQALKHLAGGLDRDHQHPRRRDLAPMVRGPARLSQHEATGDLASPGMTMNCIEKRQAVQGLSYMFNLTPVATNQHVDALISIRDTMRKAGLLASADQYGRIIVTDRDGREIAIGLYI